MKLNAKELRTIKVTKAQRKKLKKNPIYIVLDNVLDTYNIGAIFRLADAVAAEKVILCEGSETPPHTRIKKASINTTEWVAWEYEKKAIDAVLKLRKEVPNIQIVSIEQDARSTNFQKTEYKFPVAFVVGNETDGISKEVLSESDLIVELPMHGVNISLNVMVSLGIVLYQSLRYIP
jgi:tRNA G18 (ribose-2'-O)-methylase SpoU